MYGIVSGACTVSAFITYLLPVQTAPAAVGREAADRFAMPFYSIVTLALVDVSRNEPLERVTEDGPLGELVIHQHIPLPICEDCWHRVQPQPVCVVCSSGVPCGWAAVTVAVKSAKPSDT